MYIVNEGPERTDLFYNATQPVYLWLEQMLRKMRGRPSLQEEILEKLVLELKSDERLLGILLFGSVASGTQSWKSDIDLIFIYENYDPPSGLVNRWINGIEVQYFFTTLDTLIQNQETVPYLLHMFCDAEILFDRQETVRPVIEQLRRYFAGHPDIAAEWLQMKDLHQVEKKGPACAQTTIVQRWDEMEEKYSGGRRKRTFFIM
jgi:predicted nucleotidyltransferase